MNVQKLDLECQGQRPRSPAEISDFWYHFSLDSNVFMIKGRGQRSRVKVKGHMGQGQAKACDIADELTTKSIAFLGLIKTYLSRP